MTVVQPRHRPAPPRQRGARHLDEGRGPLSGSRPAWAALPVKTTESASALARHLGGAVQRGLEHQDGPCRARSLGTARARPLFRPPRPAPEGSRRAAVAARGQTPSAPPLPPRCPPSCRRHPGRATSPSMRKGRTPRADGPDRVDMAEQQRPPRPAPTEARTASPRGAQGRSSAPTPAARSRLHTQAARSETRAASSEGLSSRTMPSRSTNIRGRSASNQVFQSRAMFPKLGLDRLGAATAASGGRRSSRSCR